MTAVAVCAHGVRIAITKTVVWKTLVNIFRAVTRAVARIVFFPSSRAVTHVSSIAILARAMPAVNDIAIVNNNITIIAIPVVVATALVAPRRVRAEPARMTRIVRVALVDVHLAGRTGITGAGALTREVLVPVRAHTTVFARS